MKKGGYLIFGRGKNNLIYNFTKWGDFERRPVKIFFKDKKNLGNLPDKLYFVPFEGKDESTVLASEAFCEPAAILLSDTDWSIVDRDEGKAELVRISPYDPEKIIEQKEFIRFVRQAVALLVKKDQSLAVKILEVLPYMKEGYPQECSMWEWVAGRLEVSEDEIIKVVESIVRIMKINVQDFDVSSPLFVASSSPALGKYGTTVRSVIFRTFLALSAITGLQGDVRSGKKPLSMQQELRLFSEEFDKAQKYNEYYWMIPGKREKLDKILGGDLTQILQGDKFQIRYLLLTIYMVGFEKFEDMFNLLSDLAGGKEKAVSLLRNEAGSFATIIGHFHRLDMELELEQFKRNIYIIRDFVTKERFENNFTAEWFLGIVRAFYHARFFLGINLKQINLEVALNAFSDSVGKKIVLYKLLRQDGDIFNTVVALLKIPAKINSDDLKLNQFQEFIVFMGKGRAGRAFNDVYAFENVLIAIERMGVVEFKSWAAYLGEDEVKKLFEVNPYAFGNVFSHLYMIGQKRFKELIVLREKDEFVQDLIRDPDAIGKILKHISFDMDKGRIEAIIKEIREEHPSLFDIKVRLVKKPSNETQAILNALPPSLGPILSFQEDSIQSKNKAEKMLRISVLAVLAIFQEAFSFLTHEDYMKLTGKFLLYPRFSESLVINPRQIKVADYHMNVNKDVARKMYSYTFIGIIGHEVTHNLLPYETHSVINEFAAEAGTFAIHHLRGRSDDLRKAQEDLEHQAYAGNRNNPLDFTAGALGVSRKAMAQLLWIIEAFQKNDYPLDWNKFYKSIVYLAREQPDLTFRDFIIKLMASYLQEIGKSNITREEIDLLLAPESGEDIVSPKELNLIINASRKERGSSPIYPNPGNLPRREAGSFEEVIFPRKSGHKEELVVSIKAGS